MKHKFQMLAGAGLAVLAPVAAAHAQSNNAVGEVVVTATKTGATNLQKTPLSVSVVGGDDLDKSRVITLRDLPSAVSALKITQVNANPVVYIRGIGGFPANNEGDVALYMDGVYLGRPTIAIQSNFNDLERVEVVKGPQGTLFGRNSVGGAINFISKLPPSTFKFENTLNLGNFNLVDEAFTIGGPVTDRLRASLAVGYIKRDGFLDNVVAGQPNGGAANRTNIRAQVAFDLTDKITNVARADYMYTDEDWATIETLLIPMTDPRNVSCSVASATATPVCNPTNTGASAIAIANSITNSIIGDYTKFANFVTPHQTEQVYGFSDELTWEVNDYLTIKNIVGYRTDKSLNFRAGNSTEYATGGTHSDYREHTLSDEVDFQHNFGALTGVAGFYYYKEYDRQIGVSITANSPLRLPPLTGSESYQDTRFPTESRAVFLSETYHVTPALGVTLGARYTEETRQLDTYNTSWVWTGDYFTGGLVLKPNGAPQESPSTGGPAPETLVVFPYVTGFGSTNPKLTADSNAFTPKVGVEWQATDNAFFYASTAKGFKSGGFNFTARNSFGAYFKPEKIKAYEIGAKTDWFDKRLRVNLAAFRNDWEDLQVNVGITIPGVTTPIQVASNAAKARLTGWEADIIAKPLNGLTLTASGTFLPEAKYLDYTTGQAAGFIKNLLIQSRDPRENGVSTVNTYNASGNRLINAPEVSAIVTAQQDFDLADGSAFYVRGEYQYTSETFFDISNHPLSARAPISLYNGVIGFNPAGGRWEASLWGRNLADKQYASSLVIGNFPALTPGQPRTFGVRLNYSY